MFVLSFAISQASSQGGKLDVWRKSVPILTEDQPEKDAQFLSESKIISLIATQKLVSMVASEKQMLFSFGVVVCWFFLTSQFFLYTWLNLQLQISLSTCPLCIFLLDFKNLADIFTSSITYKLINVIKSFNQILHQTVVISIC